MQRVENATVARTSRFDAFLACLRYIFFSVGQNILMMLRTNTMYCRIKPAAGILNGRPVQARKMSGMNKRMKKKCRTELSCAKKRSNCAHLIARDAFRSKQSRAIVLPECASFAACASDFALASATDSCRLELMPVVRPPTCTRRLASSWGIAVDGPLFLSSSGSTSPKDGSDTALPTRLDGAATPVAR